MTVRVHPDDHEKLIKIIYDIVVEVLGNYIALEEKLEARRKKLSQRSLLDYPPKWRKEEKRKLRAHTL